MAMQSWAPRPAGQRAARPRPRVARAGRHGGGRLDCPHLWQGRAARRRPGAPRDLRGCRARRSFHRDGFRAGPAADADGRPGPARLPRRELRAHRADRGERLRRAAYGEQPARHARDGFLDRPAGPLLVLAAGEGGSMKISGHVACALLFAGAARAESAPAPAVTPAAAAATNPPSVEQPAAMAAATMPGQVEQAAMTELPAIGNDPAVRVALRGTPASLPPVTAQIFRIGGRTEAEPLFQMSVGDPFYRTWLVGVRVEHHLDERWSFGVHALA